MAPRRPVVDLASQTLAAAPRTTRVCAELLVHSSLSWWGMPQYTAQLVPRTCALVDAAVSIAGHHALLEVRVVLLEDALVLEVVFIGGIDAPHAIHLTDPWWWHRRKFDGQCVLGTEIRRNQ